MQYFKKSFLLNIFLAIFVLTVGYGSFLMMERAWALYSEKKDGERKILELLQKKADVEKRIAELENPETIEREAKERLNLKKKGEEIVVVLPDDAVRTAASTSRGFWGALKKFFIRP